MRCPICEVVVTNGVMSVSLGSSLLRCTQCGVHVVIVGRAAPVLSLVASSIGPITFPEVALGGNRLATWSLLRSPPSGSTMH
jgi:hypothetical protein